jgi:hypothetical protein
MSNADLHGFVQALLQGKVGKQHKVERFLNVHEIPVRVSTGYNTSIAQVSAEYYLDITRKVDRIIDSRVPLVRILSLGY